MHAPRRRGPSDGLELLIAHMAFAGEQRRVLFKPCVPLLGSHFVARNRELQGVIVLSLSPLISAVRAMLSRGVVTPVLKVLLRLVKIDHVSSQT